MNLLLKDKSVRRSENMVGTRSNRKPFYPNTYYNYIVVTSIVSASVGPFIIKK